MVKPKTIQQHVAELSRGKNQSAMIDFGDENPQWITYSSLGNQVDKLAALLVSFGCGSGKRIAVMHRPQTSTIIISLAIIRCGATLIPVDTQMDDIDLRHIIKDSRPDLFCASKELLGKVEKLKVRNLSLHEITRDQKEFWGFSKKKKNSQKSIPHVDENDTAILFYTSGTTGLPKGVPLSHANILVQFESIQKKKIIDKNDCVLLPLPVHHVYPLVIGVLVPLVIGASIILPRSTTGPDIVRAVHDGKATAIIGVPRLYAAVLEALVQRINASPLPVAVLGRFLLGASAAIGKVAHVHAGKLLLHPVHRQFGKQLRLLASGGSALDPDLNKALQAFGWRVAIGYGLTETSPLITINGPHDNRLDSAGKPIEGIDVRIEKQDAGNNIGEICVKGPNVFGGYLNLRRKTSESFTSDGFFRTGDLGEFTADGYLKLHGRVSTMIVTESGENIQPEALEQVYAKSSFIKEVAILQKEKKLVAIVVPDVKVIANRRFSIEEAVRRGMEEQSAKVAGFKRINDYVISRDELPHTRLGKLRRHLLPPLFDSIRQNQSAPQRTKPVSVEQMAESDQALVADKKAGAVWKWLTRRFEQRPLSPESSLQLDLGIDSLGWVEMTMTIRQITGVELDEQAIAKTKTVRDLLEAVSGQSGKAVAENDTDIFGEPERYIDPRQRKWLDEYGMIRKVFAYLVHRFIRSVAKCYWRVSAEGIENVPQNKQFILLPNHVSYIDPFMIASVLPVHVLSDTWWAGYAGIAFANPLTRFVSRSAKAIPIEQGQSALGELAFAMAVIQRRKNLVWFPEGRRSASGEIQKIQPGIGILLEHSADINIVPVCIEGTFQSLPVGRFFPHPSRVRVKFGTPYTIDQLVLKGKGGGKKDKIVSAVGALLAENCG
ncbi:MAG: AMP-binding protein [Fibrobacterota bacterium]